jgi:hypothetical protein
MSIHLLGKGRTIDLPPKQLLLENAGKISRQNDLQNDLYILTCYIEFSIIERTIRDLSERVKLSNVHLAFNFSEIYKDGGPIETEKKLKKIQRDLKDNLEIDFSYTMLASSSLVHGKAYAIIQRSEYKTVAGNVLVTSANFTKSGFTRGNNVELGYVSENLSDLLEFKEVFEKLKSLLGSGTEEAIFRQEDNIFRFALLSSGVFLHKWTGNLKQHVGIKYSLTALAKNNGAIKVSPELEEIGFKASDSSTRQVLDLGELPRKLVPAQFISRFTIETYWGYWCPQNAWKILCSGFSESHIFLEKLREVTTSERLEEIRQEASVTQNKLIEKGLIEPVAANHLENWVERVSELREDSHRLERFFTGYVSHELPYTIEQREEIQDLFKSLTESINLSKRMNITKKKVQDSISKKSLSALSIEASEIKEIQLMLGSQSSLETGEI